MEMNTTLAIEFFLFGMLIGFVILIITGAANK